MAIVTVQTAVYCRAARPAARRRRFGGSTVAEFGSSGGDASAAGRSDDAVRLAAVRLRTRARTVFLSAAGHCRTPFSLPPRFRPRRRRHLCQRAKGFHGVAMPYHFPATAAAVIVLTAAQILAAVGWYKHFFFFFYLLKSPVSQM